ncbi:Putative Holliday junction resolvase [Polystyrenella longa]|uniref:Putative pre-16S rRNA nuclease n=1 Tax=Polystyrenella longa TaxID=2528007 RepID=A0A518CIF1_9PLAN|nr:Holliday junction resolvase RuvX [Polystyrenella longa]QDU79005.1 Putative Holliday junction resolvase [Polystyrenella longa]
MNATSDLINFPTEGRLLGVDFGTKRVGFAVSSGDQKYSSPLTVWQRQTEKGDARFLKKLVEDNQPVGLVVGLPVHMSGDEGEVAAQVREYGDWMAETLSLPICYWDERFTSAKAERLLFTSDLNEKQRKAKIDKLAAHLMLQSFLDTDDRSQAPPSFPVKSE